jgi:tetratricopeptide (TPR) repeat protein
MAGQKEEAIQQLQEGIKLSAQSAELMTDLGEIYLDGGRLAEAEAQFRTTISVNQNYLPAKLGLGKVLRQSGRYSEAVTQLSDVLRVTPEDSGALLERGLAEYAQGLKDLARLDFQAFAKISPSRFEGHYFMGILEMNAEAYARAVVYLRQAVAIDPKLDEAYFQLGRAHEHLGELAEAQDSLQRCLALKPAHQAARSLLDRVLEAQEKLHQSHQ